ncbi:hypothetical protein LINPERHAP1_LOCUS23992 [Linum perenne]
MLLGTSSCRVSSIEDVMMKFKGS